ncbi:MAG: helix-turn-helix domain-containing protein [Chloroflexi bacterium]|nr:helix-turn-helix domain-containing protein [Chloroflexota bacterium]
MSKPDSDVIVARADEAKEIHQLESSLAAVEEKDAVLVMPNGEKVRMPASVVRLLVSGIHELARGNGVVVLPVHSDLTTQEAASLLNVSRPFLIKLLDDGEIPFYYVGSHRRIPCRDLMLYRDRRSKGRRKALAEMAREAQEMGLYE